MFPSTKHFITPRRKQVINRHFLQVVGFYFQWIRFKDRTRDVRKTLGKRQEPLKYLVEREPEPVKDLYTKYLLS